MKDQVFYRGPYVQDFVNIKTDKLMKWKRVIRQINEEAAAVLLVTRTGGMSRELMPMGQVHQLFFADLFMSRYYRAMPS